MDEKDKFDGTEKLKRKKKKYILPVTQKKTKRTDLRILKILMLIIPKLLKIKKL